VTEPNVDFAISSISDCTSRSAMPTGVASPGSRRAAAGSKSSNSRITSSSVSRRALPMNR